MYQVRKGLQNLKQYSHKENDQTIKKKIKFTCVFEFVIALIYWGFPEIIGQEFLILIGGHTPSYYQIQKAFDIIRPIFKKISREKYCKRQRRYASKLISLRRCPHEPSTRCQNAYI